MPRKAACFILSYLDLGKGSIDTLVQAQTRGMDRRDRAFVYELVYGVTRNKRALDYLIANNSLVPFQRIDKMVLMLLRIGFYQLYVMDKVPAYAAVNETVEQAKYFDNNMTRMVFFINALLRNTVRNKPPESCGPNKLRGAVESYMDNSIDPTEKLGIIYSFPQWLASRWVQDFGLEHAERLMKRCNVRAPVFIRVNHKKLNGNNINGFLQDEGISVERVNWAGDLYLVNEGQVTPGNRLFDEGYIQPQDGASYMAASLLNARQGETVADVCCGKGIKTGQFAQSMNNEGLIISVDNNQRSFEKFEENMKRQKVSIARPVIFDASTKWPVNYHFSKIFIDAPCSNYGVVRRHPEGKWNKSPDYLKTLQDTQHTMLQNALDCLKPGGSLVYAVCTVEKNECQDVVEKAIEKTPGLKRMDIAKQRPELTEFVNSQGDIEIFPGQGNMDGFYAAKLSIN